MNRLTAAEVSAALIDPHGATVASEGAGSNGAQEPIRSLRAGAPAGGGPVSVVASLTNAGGGRHRGATGSLSPAGGTPAPPSGGGAPAPAPAPALKLTAGGRERQSLRHGVVLVTCSGPVAARCSARATVRSGGKRLRSRTATRAVKPGHKTTLKLAFPKKVLARLRRAIAHHRRMKATVAFTLRDAAGRTSHASLPIRLAR